MSFQPWKPLLLTALTVGAGTTAATAQNVTAAQRAIELGRYNEARAALRGTVTPESNYELGRLYQFRDLPDSSAMYFNRAGGNTPFGMVAEGRALLAKGQTSAADAKFDAAAKTTKNKDAKVLTMIVQAYAESDIKTTAEVNRAITYADAAQTANKGKIDPALMVARGEVSLKREGGGGDAMTAFDGAIAANSSYAPAYLERGKLNVSSRNATGAIEDFNKAKAVDPKYALADYELASMYATGGLYDRALASYRDYTNQAEPSPRTTQQYAAFLYLSKKYPESLVEINKALATDPNNLTMNRLKAYSSFETGDYAGANAAMDQFMKVAPAGKVLPSDYAYKSKILGKLGQSAQAIEVLQQAIPLTADAEKKRDLQHDLASDYALNKQYNQSIAVYRDLIKTSPSANDLTDVFRIAQIFDAAQRYQQADSVYNVILTARPTYIPGYLSRARTNAHLDPDSKKGLALPYYTKYIELASAAAPADAPKYKTGLVEANYYTGVYNLQVKKDTPAATASFQKVLELDPTNVDATNAMKILTAKPKAGAPRK